MSISPFSVQKKSLVFLLPSLSFILALPFMVMASYEQWLVLLPVLTAFAITLFLMLRLWTQTGVVPLFDIGFITALATLCYTIITPVQYFISGMQFTPFSAAQLYALAPLPSEMSSFTWRYTIYLVSFVVGYITPASPYSAKLSNPVTDSRTTWAFGCVCVAMFAFQLTFKIVYGVDPNSVYDAELMNQSYQAAMQLPLLLQQLYNSVSGMFFIVKLALMFTLFLYWKRRYCRLVFYVWITTILLGYILQMASRTEVVLLLLAATILHHRFVKPLNLSKAITLGGALFAGFIVSGIMRGQTTLAANMEYVKTLKEWGAVLFSFSNEFQALFAGAYDLNWMKENGYLQNIPIQFHFYEFVAFIPQQLLPFTKINIQEWYLGLSTNPGYFMYNPVAQSTLGFGWIELIVRGALLGLVFAWLKRWYLRNSGNFWVNLFYLWLIVVSYYTIRAAGFYQLTAFIVYRFLPLYLLVHFLTTIGRIKIKSSLHSPKIEGAS